MHYPLLIVILLALFSGTAVAEADGPDYYQLHDVSSGNTLHIRAEPHPDATRLGKIPSAGDCIRNLGCQGGLTFQEFTTLSKAQQTQRLTENPRWCKIEYQDIVGWVAGRYLAEGSCTRGNAQSREQGPTLVYYTCGATDLTAVFYNQTVPQTVVLTVIPMLAGIDQVLAYHSPSASGARYEGRNVSFWEHHGEARLTWYDREMSCKVKGK